MELKEVRQEINLLDQELVQLLEKRMTLVEDVVSYKKENAMPILDAQREMEVLDFVAGAIHHKEYEQTILEIMHAVLKTSREYQARLMAKDEHD